MNKEMIKELSDKQLSERKAKAEADASHFSNKVMQAYRDVFKLGRELRSIEQRQSKAEAETEAEVKKTTAELTAKLSELRQKRKDIKYHIQLVVEKRDTIMQLAEEQFARKEQKQKTEEEVEVKGDQ